MPEIASSFTPILMIFRYLSHEDDDISETVSEFAHAYLGLLKQVRFIPCNFLSQNSKGMKMMFFPRFDSTLGKFAYFQDCMINWKDILLNLRNAHA